MPKKSKEEVLRGKLEKGFKKAGVNLNGKVFGLGEAGAYCADYVVGRAVIEVIMSPDSPILGKIAKFKKTFGYRYQVFAFVEEHMRDVLMVKPCDAIYTEKSLGLLIKEVKSLKEE